MSWADLENGSVEIEENPDPEEDSDLPQRQHQDVEEFESRVEEDGPEEDLVVSQEAIDIADTHNIPADQADVQSVENVGSHLNSVLGACDAGNITLPTAQLTGPRKPDGLQHFDSAAVGTFNGDSFEQDEETAAPESENGARHDMFSESDRQLFHIHEALTNQSDSGVISIQTKFSELQESVNLDSECKPEIQCVVTKLATAVDTGSQQNVESLCTFTGDIEVANSFDDAPEAEVGALKQDGRIYPFEEEDNLNLFSNQNGLDVSHVSVSVSLEDNPGQPEESASDLHIRNSADVHAHNMEPPIHESIDQDLQAPECDREVSYHQIPSNSHHQIYRAQDVNFEGSLLAQRGNNLNVMQVTLEEDKVSVLAVPVSQLELESRGDHSASDSSYLSANDAHTASLTENVLTMPESTESNRAEIISGQNKTEYPSSFPSDEILDHHSMDSSKMHQPDVTSSAHQSSATNMSQNEQPNSLHSLNQLENSSNSVLAQQNDSSLNPANTGNPDVDNTSDICRSHEHFNSQEHPSASVSQCCASFTSQHSSAAKVWSQIVAADSNHIERQLALTLQSDDEDELLHELDAELLAHASRTRSPKRSSAFDQKDVISERGNSRETVNGLQSLVDFRQMQEHNRQLLEQLKIRDEEIEKLTHERDSVKDLLARVQSQLVEEKQRQNSDIYLPQIKQLENTVAQQQNEIKALKEKLVSHDSAAKRAVTTLQNELKSRVDQVTKMYEECLKEKDLVVIRFAESEAKNMEAKQTIDKIEAKLKDTLKDKDNMMNLLKAAKADKVKAVTNFEMKCAEVSNLQKELEKLKEAVNSSEYRIKWFQNKLKEELENHKETKASLEKTTMRLKEAREETEVIRKECHAIVKRYQESEEIKSVSLDKELKLKETELQTQMQERNDTEEIHQMTKKELESLKSQHKDLVEEVKTKKDKVHCLEEERKQNYQMIESHQEIMQRQKAEITDLKAKIASLSTLEEGYKRAQEMIVTLDKDIADLKILNRDLQKDTEACRERESKMLILQSELSRTNAVLRSENTILSNKASLLTGEVEKLKMEIQELETAVKNLSDKYKEEKTKRKEEMEKMGASLAEKVKECNELKQKWEDEIDNSKTLKRRHANNVKDLTRQLQQVRKRLDTLEGKGDNSSMGSRTNSNGSLNSIENSSQQSAVFHQSGVQEFPVITEQVEVDKQVLIERIVRLQKSHARKNEKLEFLGEHIQQLLEEIRKKNKIIQSYALREEAGTLSSEDMDANKERVVQMYKAEVQREIQSLLARKGGIMASVYTVHQQDGSMTLELSLQINRKLQAVLEDTLLKNITLKESLDTLGEEIARLSQENRRLQLSLQQGQLT